MNHIYRTLWSAALGACVAVAETAKGAGKGTSSRSHITVVDATESDGFTLKPACRAALVLLAALSLCTPQANAANAADATVSLGSGNVATTGNTTTITQASQRLAIDWTNLSTRANEALVFAQPNAQAIALNRITGSSPSEFLGSLTANGQVFILNPNGVLFGAGSQVNVGGLIASTLSMSNADFESGNFKFSGSGAGSVVNQGTLTAAPGGYLALLAPEVRNEGVMTASLGTALLAAGGKVTLNLDNGSLLGYSIDQGAINALAENKHLIQANGGQVLLSARAMDSLTTATVNNTGVIEARTIQNKAGRILLMGDMEMGTVNVAGTLDASAPNGGDGGFIETSAAHVKVATGTSVTTQAPQGKTGKWLIDPQDYTIAASGGDMSGADLNAALTTTDVEIQSVQGATAGNGDIHVNDAVNWSANKLTLTAERDINVNTVVSATGSASLALNTGATGNLNMKMKADGTGFEGRVDLDTSGTLHINGEQYTIIRSLGTLGSSTPTDLQGMRHDPSGRYVLGADIDASETATGNAFGGDWADTLLPPESPWGEFYLRTGMRPLSTAANAFSGKFDGLGHRISRAVMGLDVLSLGDAISNPVLDSMQPMGLFGAVAASGKVSNLDLYALRSSVAEFAPFVYAVPPGAPHASVRTGWYGAIGSLAGTNAGTVRNILVNPDILVGGLIETSWALGGVVGDNTGTIQNVLVAPHALGGNSTASFGSSKYMGGIAGRNFGLIEGSRSDVPIYSFAFSTGGIAGFNGVTGVVRDSTAGAEVIGFSVAGGALGMNQGLVERVHSSAIVSGGHTVGGLVGINNTTIRDSSASGNVEAGQGLPRGNERFDPLAGRWVFDDVDGTRGVVGGLVGSMAGGSISGSHASGGVHLAWGSQSQLIDAAAGGLVGRAEYWPGWGFVTIRDSWASGNVSQVDHAASTTGGFAGRLGEGTTVERTYATGNVTVGRTYLGFISTGGFVGVAEHMTIRQSYATGNVQGTDANLGGFAGSVLGSGTSLVEDCYATGNVTRLEGTLGGVGGFVANSRARFVNSYTTGAISSLALVWLFGDADNPGNTNLFYNTANSTVHPDVRLGPNQTGKTEAELMQASTFAGFNISATGGSGSVWRIYEGHTTPLLRSFLTPLNLADAPNITQTYNGTTQTAAATAMVDANLLGTAASGRNAGLYNGYYSTQQGYDISGGNLTITPANLVLTTTDVSKTYNSQLDAAGVWTATGGTQLFGSDTATGGSFAFLDKNAGTGKTVTVGGATLNDGNNGGNYNVSYADNTSSTINRADLTVSGITAADKTYNASDTATVSTAGASYNGLFAGDVVNVAATGLFSGKNAGTNKTVALTSSYSGADVGNYAITDQATTTASISQANLTVSSSDVIKTYDGGMAAAGTAVVTAGTVFGGDSLTGGNFDFTDKNVGSGNKTVTTSGVTVGDGVNNGNYNVSYVDNTTSTINKADLTVTATGVTKTYDGTTSATGTGSVGTLAGAGAGEVVNTAATQAFADKNAGIGNKTVQASGLTIKDSGNVDVTGNYNIAYVDNTTSTINRANLTVTANAVTKTYDGTLNASGTGSVGTLAGAGAGESVNAAATQLFTDKNFGIGNKTVQASGLTIKDSGNADVTGNYNIAYVDNTTSTINKADVTLSTSDVTKTYDGGFAASGAVVVTAGAIFMGDNATGGSFAFTDKNAGSGNKTVTAAGVTVGDGVNNANYNITYADNTTSTINQANLTLTTSSVTKTYDGNTTAAGAATVTAGTLFGGDTLAGGSFAFTDQNAGNGNKTVQTSGVTVGDGVNNANYNVTYADNTTSTINPFAVSVSGTRTYDGTADVAAGVLNIGPLVGSETLGLSGLAAMADKNVGANKTLTVAGLSLIDGSGLASNYTFTGGTQRASITQASLTVGAGNVTKTYDSNLSAAGAATVTAGTLFSGDSLTGGTFAFTDKNAGTGNKTVTTSGVTVGDGVNNGNYAVTYANNTTSTINRADLTVTASGVNKVYDGTTAATVGYGDNRLGSDVLSVTGAASFADKNAGVGKAVGVSGIALGGTDAGNYNLLNTTAGTTASITPKALTVTANNDSKLYDGAAYSGGNGVNYNGFVTGESVSALTGTLAYSGSSQGASAAGNYAITPGGYSAANYTLAYVDGVLRIGATPVVAPTLVPPAVTDAFSSAMVSVAGAGLQQGGPQSQKAPSGPDSFIEPDNRNDDASGNGNGSETGSSNGSDNGKPSSSLVSVISCGLLMPRGVNSAICE
ncbi:YDG domain-containing protein [Polaromonas sp.]|uniref:YDG domain-containing protein n=1 Tax=Polaromonas sp. TaxID=1869339 RepID=UPI003C935E99